MLGIGDHLAPESAIGLGRNTHVLSASMVHADETWWRLMGSTKKRWWVWAVQSESAVFCKLLDNRSTHAASEMLGGYEGEVMVDGYGAYQALAKDRGGGSRIKLGHCWTHCRRKFVEAEDSFPEPARTAIEFIRKLYLIERMVPRGQESDTETAAARLHLRAQLRNERSREVVAELKSWAENLPVLPKSSIGRAVGYMRELWPGLIRFLEDPRIPLDNNAVERSLRGIVLGRKNHLGSRSKRGLEVAALYYSLIETAKLRGVEPKRYLLAATHAAIATPGTITLP